MWIRSQSLAVLVKVNEICIEDKTKIWAEGYLIGKYSTEEKDKHFEEKSKTNLEFYYDDLLEEGSSDFAVVNGKIKSCLYVPCDKCEFKKKDCSKDRITWLLSQRKKPKYKFTQFEYDLINTYRHVDDRCKFNGCYQLKSLKEKGYFKNVDKNELIKDILENCEVIKND